MNVHDRNVNFLTKEERLCDIGSPHSLSLSCPARSQNASKCSRYTKDKQKPDNLIPLVYGYTTVSGSTALPEENEGWRGRLRFSATNPAEQGSLFIYARVIGRAICEGFAAITANGASIEGIGKPYNIYFQQTEERLVGMENWKPTVVRPRDIVRFAINNIQPPITIVTCDYCDLLATPDRPSFFNDFCLFEELGKEQLSSGSKELCMACPPSNPKRGYFVSEDRAFLSCRYHAKRFMANGKELLLYRPTLVSMSANATCAWLSGVTDPSRDATPLSFIRVPEYWKSGDRFDSDGVLLRRIAEKAGFQKTAFLPINIAKAMQFLCFNKFFNERLCSRTEKMVPMTELKVHRFLSEKPQAK